jgi:hypothetical protein
MMVLCEPKHVGAVFIILIALIGNLTILCNLCALVGEYRVKYY